MATEGFSHVVSFEVRGRMPSNCYIVVINEKLDIETICDCNAGSLCSVSFHLRTINSVQSPLCQVRHDKCRLPMAIRDPI